MLASNRQLSTFLEQIPAKTLQKARNIFEGNSRVINDDSEITVLEEGPRSVRLSVPSETDYFGYEVKLSWTAAKVSCRCNCMAYEDTGRPCKHIAAAVYYLLDELKDELPERNSALEVAEIVEDAPNTVAQPQSPGLSAKRIIHTRPDNIFQSINYKFGWGYHIPLGEIRKIAVQSIREEEAIWDFTYRQSAKQTFYPRIAYNRRETFTLSCSCNVDSTCPHLQAAFSWLFDKYGLKYFAPFRDFSAEKIIALKKLGLAPDDPDATAVKFSVNDLGQLVVEIPGWLWPADRIATRIDTLQQKLHLQPAVVGEPPVLTPPKAFKPAFVLHTATGNLPFPLELCLVNTAGGKFTKVNLHNEERWPELKAVLPQHVYEALISISHPALNAALKKAGHYQALPNSNRDLSSYPVAFNLIEQRYFAALNKLWPVLSEGGQSIFVSHSKPLTVHNSIAVRLHPEPVVADIHLERSGNFIRLRLQYEEAATGLPVEGMFTGRANLLLSRDDADWYLPSGEKTLRLMAQFPHGFIKVPLSAKGALFLNLLPALRRDYKVTIEPELLPEKVAAKPVPSLHLTEQGNSYLVLQPRFTYGKEVFYYETEPEPKLMEIAPGEWAELVHDESAEAAFAQLIQSQHPSFAESRSLQTFYLTFSEALKDGWYQRLIADMEEMGVPVTGLSQLQHFRYNANPAQVSISSTAGDTGIDWFDLLIEVSFGDQRVPLKEVRRALMNGQAGIRLADGTIGLLPVSFVAHYGALLKLGTESKDGKLRINKLHFTLIDSLHEAALSRDMAEEIAAKKEKLRHIEDISTVAVPAAIIATLRPYQLAGYQWLQVLDELGWGGCLADDMGLGKTLQTITFLQYLKEKYPGSRQLIICPTSLIYNWQAELDKFAPELRYHIHYGAARVWNDELLADKDILITTYGLVRSDLEALVKTKWHYVVLDESQAIKNPDAQTTKAVQALPARNRIALSGTPLQNNTFDLFAQFQFLNPGLLGNRDFFRTEFATPIDKHSEEAPRAALRRMLAPFMLRRTKEQVAKDLPDKIEAILWCRMEPEQRVVYDEYRHYYRDSLLNRIDTEGMAGSAIYVLEALLRLRQLCDHPALVKNTEVKTSESIKLAELRREINENAGGRKVLVFSQFTEMLAVIAAAFTEDGIRFAYLDGKTPAIKRKEAVKEFQENPEVQVFLISLKAGGVGLNLTGAEYVYLVDPWWNPAVEAQAIDRTHRIGQKNKIVAYRMICKDSVEEKVMQLQARKRALAEGLVTEDAGFIKKLTRDDIAFLLE